MTAKVSSAPWKEDTLRIRKTIKQILRKHYSGIKPWKAFIYWWLAANGYDYDVRREHRVRFVDGRQDGGLDAIAWPLENQSHNRIFVVQSKYYDQQPTAKDLARFREAIEALNGSLNEFQDWLASCRDDLHGLYRKLREDRKRHRYVLIAPCRFDWTDKRTLERIGVEVHDIEMLTKLERNYTEGRTPRLDEIRMQSATPPKIIAEANGTKVWLFTALARELGALFERHNNILFAGNIRYALRGETARRVRKGMLETLEEHPHEFVFSHNGITVTGDGIKRKGKTVIMNSATIVNGAQTVSYFGQPNVMRRLANNPARVVIKFVQVDHAETLNDIESKVAYRSNNQNKVEPSDLMIELPSLVSLQRYFRREGLHLERKKGEQKLNYGELGIAKERLAQVLAAIGSPEGAVKGKRKQELFEDSAHGMFSDFDASEQTRAEAVAWTRIDHSFRSAISEFANDKRRKRAQLAELAALTVFHRVLKTTGIKLGFLRAVSRYDSNSEAIDKFVERSFRVIASALLRCSSRDRKNEPAFYKATENVKSAVESATWRSKRKIRQYYSEYLGT